MNCGKSPALYGKSPEFDSQNGHDSMMQFFGIVSLCVPYPLVICHIAIENGPVEIVDFPSYTMVDLSIVTLVL